MLRIPPNRRAHMLVLGIRRPPSVSWIPPANDFMIGSGKFNGKCTFFRWTEEIWRDKAAKNKGAHYGIVHKRWQNALGTTPECFGWFGNKHRTGRTKEAKVPTSKKGLRKIPVTRNRHFSDSKWRLGVETLEIRKKPRNFAAMSSAATSFFADEFPQSVTGISLQCPT